MDNDSVNLHGPLPHSSQLHLSHSWFTCVHPVASFTLFKSMIRRRPRRARCRTLTVSYGAHCCILAQSPRAQQCTSRKPTFYPPHSPAFLHLFSDASRRGLLRDEPQSDTITWNRLNEPSRGDMSGARNNGPCVFGVGRAIFIDPTPISSTRCTRRPSSSLR
jgi:hypothetical protein